MKISLLVAAIAAAFAMHTACAADLYVSLEKGKNKNLGTEASAPMKNLWKALEVAQPGDVIHVAQGTYPGKMKCGWFRMEKPVSIIGGYVSDFSVRDPLTYRTLFQPTNAQNATKPNFGMLEIMFRNYKGFKIVLDGLIFDDGQASSFHRVKGKPEGVETGMWLPPLRNV